MVEEWKTHASYDMGLETERAAREKLQKQSIHHEEVKRHISYWKFSRVSLKKLSYSEQDTKAGFKKKKKKKKCQYKKGNWGCKYLKGGVWGRAQLLSVHHKLLKVYYVCGTQTHELEKENDK